jgi:hypothetical protein
MATQTISNNQYNINPSNNDELQSSTQMLKFETEFERTEKQIIYLEKLLKSHLSIIVNYELLTQDPDASVAGLLYYEYL